MARHFINFLPLAAVLLGSSLGFLDGKKDFPQLGPKISSQVISPDSTQYDRPLIFCSTGKFWCPKNMSKRYLKCCRRKSVDFGLFESSFWFFATWRQGRMVRSTRGFHLESIPTIHFQVRAGTFREGTMRTTSIWRCISSSKIKPSKRTAVFFKWLPRLQIRAL